MKMETDNRRLRVLIVDDHSVLRDSLRMVLEDLPDILVVDEAENGAGALEACRSNPYDIILLDIRLPDMSGPEVAQALRAHGIGARIIGLSMRDEESFRRQMLHAGADDFISKAEGAERLIEAIRSCRR